MLCQLCQKPIGLWGRLLNRRFCSEEHHQQYVRAHHEFARKELEKRDPSKGHIEPVPEHPKKTDDTKPVVSPAPPEEANKPVAEPVDATELPAHVREQLAHFLTAVEQDRHFYQEILDNTPISIGVVTSDHQIRYANASFRRVGKEAFEGTRTPKLDDLGFRENLMALVETVRRSEVAEEQAILRSPEQDPNQVLRAAVIPLSTGEILLVLEDLSHDASVPRGESLSSAHSA